jgi:predicted CXXCH cytochrome family protein
MSFSAGTKLGPFGSVAAAIAFLSAIAAMVMLRAIAAEVRTPFELSSSDYSQSRSCMPCHPDHHASWYRTFHRTMTQRATPSAVLGDFDNAAYAYAGVTSRFTREGDRFFIETLDTDGRLQRFEIAMTVGSRRIQQYVARVGDRHIRLPLAWNIEDRRWFHLAGGFLHPDGSDFNTHTALWDTNCIFCHNVKANPAFDVRTERFASQVAELGIACEACHGPGEEHIRRNTSPLRRYVLHASETRDPTIHSPLELPKEQLVQLCGHCHGQRIPNPLERIEEFIRRGDPYTAGEDLSEYTTPIDVHTEMEGVSFAPRFWGDGTARLTAYEYQGLLQSKDYQHGELTCISCHSMHGGDPKGMITEEKRGAAACVSCHPTIGEDIPAHTKHAAQSTGSNCYSCHMPKITYGLLAVHPTHRIQNPDPSRAWRHDMPEACTLCHTNQTARWAADSMIALYGTPPLGPGLQDPAFQTAEGVRSLLAGDVVQRAIAIEALSTSLSYTDDPVARLWVVPFLLFATEDNYPAARYFAFRGLRAIVERAALTDDAIRASLQGLPSFDPLAEPMQRETAIAPWRDWWKNFDKSRIEHPGAAVPLDEKMQLIDSMIEELVRTRDDEIIAIGE